MRHAQIFRRDMMTVGDDASSKARIGKGGPDKARIARGDL